MFEESVYSSVEGEKGVEVCLLLPSGRGTMRGLLMTESGTALGWRMCSLYDVKLVTS